MPTFGFPPPGEHLRLRQGMELRRRDPASLGDFEIVPPGPEVAPGGPAELPQSRCGDP